jgi:DNA primase
MRTLVPDWKARRLPKYNHLGKVGQKDFLYWWQPNLVHIHELNEAIIVEAEKSQMWLESHGVMNAVACGSHNIITENEEMLLQSGVKNVTFAYDKDVDVKEILKQTTLLRRYVNCWYVKDRFGFLDEKDSPTDKGFQKRSAMIAQ